MTNNVIKYWIFILVLFVSCDRFGTADKSKLRGYDYRLFQGTPVWNLAKAVRDGDVSEIRAIVKDEKVNLEFKEEKFGQTLLMLAILNQQFESTNALLELGANPNHHDIYDGSSPIIDAAEINEPEDDNTRFIALLLKHGGNPNDLETGDRREGNTTRTTPLLAAIEGVNRNSSSLPKVKLLVNAGADIDFRNEYGITPLGAATTFEKLDVIIYLLEKGVDYKQILSTWESKNYFLWDRLRTMLFPLDSDQFLKKKAIIKFLQEKGINYDTIQIPEYAISQAKKLYPDNWKEYLEKY